LLIVHALWQHFGSHESESTPEKRAICARRPKGRLFLSEVDRRNERSPLWPNDDDPFRRG
jgi:hypothetical protein